MKFLSLCAGIEAASVAWNPLGFEAVGFSEIDRFPCAVLAHRHAGVPNYGDMTRYQEWPNLGSVDLVVGGTPCQSYSVAGLRAGLDDPRGDLMLTFGAIARAVGARWLVWENVPGVLSSNDGRDFGTFLGLLAELGYGFAYRILDAQFCGVPQQRRRVFVVGHLGDWRRAAAVLFERSSLSGNPAPSREAGEGTAPCLGAGPASGGRKYGTDADSVKSLIAFGGNDTRGPISAAAARLNHAGRLDFGSETFLVSPVAFQSRVSASNSMNPSQASPSLDKGKAGGVAMMSGSSVRRLTPLECERLQGFPDGYTAVPYRKGEAKDGPRYKALGNSMAVPVMRWIGERIAMVDRIAP